MNSKAALLRSVIIFDDFRLKFSNFVLFNNFLYVLPTFPYCRVSVAPVAPVAPAGPCGPVAPATPAGPWGACGALRSNRPLRPDRTCRADVAAASAATSAPAASAAVAAVLIYLGGVEVVILHDYPPKERLRSPSEQYMMYPRHTSPKMVCGVSKQKIP